jgi:hypothetical protein
MISSTKSTYLFCAGESDIDDEDTESVGMEPESNELNDFVEGTIPTLQAEILELDTVGFDEVLPMDESLDMYSIEDA